MLQCCTYYRVQYSSIRYGASNLSRWRFFLQYETVLHALRPCFRPPPFLPIRPFLLLLFSSLPELSLPEAEVFSSSVALSFSLCVSCHVSPPVVLSHHVTSDSLPSLRILPPPYIRRAGGRKPHWRGGVSQEEEGERREERHHRPDPSERGNPDRRPPTKRRRRRRSVFGGGLHFVLPFFPSSILSFAVCATKRENPICLFQAGCPPVSLPPSTLYFFSPRQSPARPTD